MTMSAKSFCASLAILLFNSTLWAANIDDFSVGPLEMNVAVYTGTRTVDQPGLDASHVVGGRRRVTYDTIPRTNGATGEVSVAVRTDFGHFKYEADPGVTAANLGISYGERNNGLLPDLTSAGENSLVLDFEFANFESGTGYFDFQVYTQSGRGYVYMPVKNSAHSFSLVLPFIAFNRNGLVADFSAIRSVEFGTANGNLRGSFAMTAVRTANFSPGDYNFDGSVDGKDYQVWQAEFGRPYSPYPVLSADGNRDGNVDAADYSIWRDNRSSNGGDASAALSVPEPFGIATLIAGAMLTIVVTRARP
jgi:hypothetical protein